MPHRKQAWAKRVRKDRFKKKYLSRMQATRLLQTDSMGFRRLCILKGIFPRAIGKSKQKESGNEKQYYLAKEIKWLVRDQIAAKMYDYKAWEKRVRRANAKQETSDLKRLHSERVKPKYSLVASIKERYPFFIDAVRDLDDALSIISLYAFLSPEVRSNTTIEFHHSLPSGLHEKAKAIMKQWNGYVAKSQSLTKGFISIKGYYFEAIIKGERVRWLTPHEYASKFPSGVQQYILITFLEFYLELVRFVLFRLEHDLAKDVEERIRIEDEGAEANAENFATGVVLPGQQVQGQAAVQLHEQSTRLQGATKELDRLRSLFAGFVFYVSREVPSKHMELIVTACGGRVATEMGPSVTHVVIDRPQLPPGMQRQSNVEYVQPQYVFDCLNARVVLPVQGYKMGDELPPHVSPFTVAINPNPEDTRVIEETKKSHPKIVGYVPERVHQIRKFIDPSYSSIDPSGKVAELEHEYSDDEDHAPAPEMDAEDDVALSDEELEDAKKIPDWKDEKVTEKAERSKLSAFKVKKQRELNLMNAPSSEMAAMRRQAKVQQTEAHRKSETRDARIKRKLAEKEKQERATRKMQLQVARKKAARYYKMVSSVVDGNKKKEMILAAKAKRLAEGLSKVDDEGKTIVKPPRNNNNNKSNSGAGNAAGEGSSNNKNKKKTPNPYSKLPKWVR
jgi:pescadillo protein